VSREDVAVEECVDKRAEMPQYLTEASASSIFSNGISSSLRWVRTHAEPPCVVQNSADFFFLSNKYTACLHVRLTQGDEK
jgi:hypothetical protein